jgi:hypothetical protein
MLPYSAQIWKVLQDWIAWGSDDHKIAHKLKIIITDVDDSSLASLDEDRKVPKMLLTCVAQRTLLLWLDWFLHLVLPPLPWNSQVLSSVPAISNQCHIPCTTATNAFPHALEMVKGQSWEECEPYRIYGQLGLKGPNFSSRLVEFRRIWNGIIATRWRITFFICTSTTCTLIIFLVFSCSHHHRILAIYTEEDTSALSSSRPTVTHDDVGWWLRQN